MEAAHLQHLIIFLTNLNDASCDFGECAKQRGVTRKNNALRDFKAMMKKYDVDYDGKKFTTTSAGDSIDNDETAPTTPAAKKASTPRKRKVDGEATTNGNDDKSSPTKKRSTKPSKKEDVKAENDADDVKIDSAAED